MTPAAFIFLLLVIQGSIGSKQTTSAPTRSPMGYSEPEAVQLAAVSAATYCNVAMRQLMQNWTCVPCKKVSEVVFRELVYNSKTETFGFIATRGTTIIIAFRGTVRTEEENIFSNIQVWRSSPYPEFPQVGVHSGFWNSFNSVRFNLIQAIQRVSASLEGKVSELIFTGHSLGGALASLAAFEYTRNLSKDARKLPIKLVTFGAPRVGEVDFANELSKRLTTSWRITNWKDPVVQIPSRRLGFRHAQREIFYSHSMKNYTICADAKDEDPLCSDRFPSTTIYSQKNLHDHLYYFNIRIGEACNAV
eukprot:TRINITY_DN275_c0_g1_i1.p1 TRINITY_DN275_c0_g1~~TRINITY_DN275_c0_g1_i1.p1  ORF type:complete len:305 (-),score=29.09 TRINITY_DN275_c0_g1_i1:29-943(-)